MTVWQYREATGYGKDKAEVETPPPPKVDPNVPIDEPQKDGTPEEPED